jgi:ribosomal protein L32
MTMPEITVCPSCGREIEPDEGCPNCDGWDLCVVAWDAKGEQPPDCEGCQ